MAKARGRVPAGEGVCPVYLEQVRRAQYVCAAVVGSRGGVWSGVHDVQWSPRESVRARVCSVCRSRRTIQLCNRIHTVKDHRLRQNRKIRTYRACEL